jgi:hypothetical protein
MSAPASAITQTRNLQMPSNYPAASAPQLVGFLYSCKGTRPAFACNKLNTISVIEMV